ncbi:MAG: DNA polymerase IV [Flavobacteriaceae bacterium]|tara:strand:- start:9318 stop:10406 length:1089 start_codon:yes stop_codon:yes gene_type:complete
MAITRKIIHIDMDAFYASVEQLDNPLIRNKPVAVGSSDSRGVVAAASYEARSFGVRSAMSSKLAKKLCPDLIFAKPRFERYKEFSKIISEVFSSYTDLVETLSLDEAYLDVTENKKGIVSASKTARLIREDIFEKTGLTSSAGISINKLVAKIASDFNKPNGQKTVPPEEINEFMEDLDIRKFHGIGKATAQKMYQMGIFKGIDLKKKGENFLVKKFGKSGSYYFNAANGINLSPVSPNRKAKSLGSEQTFSKNISSEIFLIEKINIISNKLSKRLKKLRISGKTITLKIKYSDFVTQTRSTTKQLYISDKSLISKTCEELLYNEKLRDSVRLIGITISNFKQSNEKKKSNKSINAQLKIDF